MKQELAVVFLLETLEQAQGAVAVYRAATDAMHGRERRRQLTQLAEAAARDVAALQQVCAALAVNAEHPTTAREIVKDASSAMVKQLGSALAEADRTTAEAIAWQGVMLSETRSLANYRLLAVIGPRLPEAAAAVWLTIGPELVDGATSRLSFAEGAWRELLLRRLDLEPADVADASSESARDRDATTGSGRGRETATDRDAAGAGA